MDNKKPMGKGTKIVIGLLLLIFGIPGCVGAMFGLFSAGVVIFAAPGIMIPLLVLGGLTGLPAILIGMWIAKK